MVDLGIPDRHLMINEERVYGGIWGVAANVLTPGVGWTTRNVLLSDKTPWQAFFVHLPKDFILEKHHLSFQEAARSNQGQSGKLTARWGTQAK